ncbi:MAG TPA: Gfo/Idh/MocA family oxidoreductase [Parafilimonas sp.]|nr:Gfo/Idh/MocA family oxidoreductase [Parafilimonas sp.]
MPERNLNIGIVGAGSFADFAAKAFLKVEGVRIVAVADINEKIAAQLASSFNAKPYADYEVFLNDRNIDLVYIATPPFLHYQQSKAALLAGKHVICEKPAALKASEARELAALADSRQLLYVVNLMQRYNPLYSIVNTIINEKILGGFLHGFFENYASDESLDSNHWFWDESKSGGIFIEHGVHFFDMFSGWLGEGKVISAFQIQRPSVTQKINDRVQATVLYHDGLVNFYHGFDQPKILDRQEMRLQFEHGDITLYGWIPVKVRLHGLFQKQSLEKVCELLSGCAIQDCNETNEQPQTVRGRFSNIPFDEHVTIEYGSISEKHGRYQQVLIAMISDQWMWIKDKSHQRIIDQTNAVQSLKTAEEATVLAQQF